MTMDSVDGGGRTEGKQGTEKKGVSARQLLEALQQARESLEKVGKQLGESGKSVDQAIVTQKKVSEKVIDPVKGWFAASN